MIKLSTFCWQLLAACLLAICIVQHYAINRLADRLDVIAGIAEMQGGWVYFIIQDDDEGGCK
jgi:hypothetical protein